MAGKTRFSADEYQDTSYSVAFVVSLVGVVGWIGAAAATGGYTPAADEAASLVSKHGGMTAAFHQMRHGELLPQDDGDKATIFLSLLFVGILFGIIFAMIWLMLISLIPTMVVKAAIVSLPILCFAFGGYALASGSVVPGAILVLVGLVFVFWAWWVWDRVEFTGHLVKTASDTYAKSSAIYGIAALLIVGQAVWTIVWLIAVIPICRSDAGSSVMLWPFLLLSYYWTAQVFSNVLFVSCSGVMARHYYNISPESSVGSAFTQAMTISFGSICFGSLLIAIIQTLRALCRQAQRDAEEEGDACTACLACVASCILGMIEEFMDMINTFAFIYVAIYGMNFWDSATEAFNLMTDSDSLVSYSLVDTVSFFGSLAGGAFTGGMLAMAGWRAGLTGGFLWGLAFLGFITGLAIMSIVSRMIEAGALTMFVCYTEEPKIMDRFDDELCSLFNERRTISNN